MLHGGLYNVLLEITKFINNDESVSFTHTDVVNITGLSNSAVTKNLKRLVNDNFITKEYYYLDGCQGRFVRYQLRGRSVVAFVMEVLVND